MDIGFLMCASLSAPAVTALVANMFSQCVFVFVGY
jgi:hypothetical protein